MNRQQYRRQWAQQKRLAKLSKGLCSLSVKCMEPLVEGKTECSACLKKLAARVKVYRKEN